MKYLVLIGVLVLAWVLFFKVRRKPPPVGRPDATPQVAAMLACTHCGLHVPKAEALFDASGRPYCGEAHRLAGPQ
ncbi:MAG: PP0621 family protein [Rubrivivax sp.]|nr:PP0621 family protein [Rubrivivax sp.]